MIKQSKMKKSRRLQRKRRHYRVRSKIWGTAERPRLTVYRSLRNIEGQLINDDESRTLLGFSTLSQELSDFESEGDQRRVEQSFEAGRKLAEKAVAEGISTVIFDRGGYPYHGRVKAFAEGAREGGLEF
jgi:large subunit ribosomal protein L18